MKFTTTVFVSRVEAILKISFLEFCNIKKCYFFCPGVQFTWMRSLPNVYIYIILDFFILGRKGRLEKGAEICFMICATWNEKKSLKFVSRVNANFMVIR